MHKPVREVIVCLFYFVAPRCYLSDSTQTQIFEHEIRPFVDAALKGDNATGTRTMMHFPTCAYKRAMN